MYETGVRALLTEKRAVSLGVGGETGREFTEVAPRNTFLLGCEAGKRLI